MKGSLLAVVTAVCALLVCAPGVARAQSLVIQGGTLIDGTGSPPVPNAVIVIQNGRFAAVGRAGEVPAEMECRSWPAVHFDPCRSLRRCPP